MVTVIHTVQTHSLLLQIEDEVEKVHGKNVVSPNVIVGLFLVSQGADIYIKNMRGVSPLQTQPVDISALLTQYLSNPR